METDFRIALRCLRWKYEERVRFLDMIYKGKGAIKSDTQVTDGG